MPGRVYLAVAARDSRMFRLSIGDSVSDNGTEWAIEVEEMQHDGQWHHVTEMDTLDPNKNLNVALQTVIRALGTYAQ